MRAQSSVPMTIETIREELSRTPISSSTMNLIVWIDDRERRNWVLERAEMLSEKHPSFCLILDRTGASSEATVLTSQRDADTHLTTQGETVLLNVQGFAPAQAVEYVLALCRDNVPTILWWTGTRADRPFFEALLPHVATIVVDASGGERDESTLCSLYAWHRDHPNVRLRDLAWLRLRPWQEMIAHFFDDPALLDELNHITGLHIKSGSDAEALYLGGWLASRLGWTPSGRDAFTSRTGAAIGFTRERIGGIRRVTSVCLDSESSWYHGEVTGDDQNVVRVWVEGKFSRDPRLFTLNAIDNASLLELAVLQTGSDEVFETALRSAGTLVGGGA